MNRNRGRERTESLCSPRMVTCLGLGSVWGLCGTHCLHLAIQLVELLLAGARLHLDLSDDPLEPLQSGGGEQTIDKENDDHACLVKTR